MTDEAFQPAGNARVVLDRAKALAHSIREVVENTGRSAHGVSALQHADEAVRCAEAHLAAATAGAHASIAAPPVVLLAGGGS